MKMQQIGWLNPETGGFVSIANASYWLQPGVYGNEDLHLKYTIPVYVEEGKAPTCVLDISDREIWSVRLNA